MGNRCAQEKLIIFKNFIWALFTKSFKPEYFSDQICAGREQKAYLLYTGL